MLSEKRFLALCRKERDQETAKSEAQQQLHNDKVQHSENLELSELLGVGDIHAERVRAICRMVEALRLFRDCTGSFSEDIRTIAGRAISMSETPKDAERRGELPRRQRGWSARKGFK